VLDWALVVTVIVMATVAGLTGMLAIRQGIIR